MLDKIAAIRDEVGLIQSKTKCQQNLAWLNTILGSMLDKINFISCQIPKDKKEELCCKEENEQLREDVRLLEMVLKKQDSEMQALENKLASSNGNKSNQDIIESLKTENACFKTQVNIHKEEIKCLKKAMSLKESGSSDPCPEKTSEIGKLKEIICCKSKEIDSLKNQVESERAEMHSNSQCLDMFKRKYLECQEQAAQIRSQGKCPSFNESTKECLNQIIDDKKKRIEQLEFEVCELKNSNDTACLKAELCEAKKKCEELSREIKSLHSKGDSLEGHNQQFMEMEKTNFKLKNEIERQKKSFDLAKEHQEQVLETVLDKLNDSKQEIQKKNSEICALKCCQRKLEENASRLNDEIKCLKCTMERKEKEQQNAIQCLENKNRAICQKKSEIQENLYKANNDVLEKTMELNMSNEKIKSLEQKLECACIETERLKTQLKRSACCIADRDKQIQCLTRDLCLETSKSKALQETLQNQKTTTSCNEDETKKLKEWLCRCEENLANLQTKMEKRNKEEEDMNSCLQQNKCEMSQMKNIINTLSNPPSNKNNAGACPPSHTYPHQKYPREKTIASNTNLNTFPDLESKEVELNPKSHTNTRPTDIKGSSVKRCSCHRGKDSKHRTQNGKSNNFSKDAFSNLSPVGSIESFQNLLGTKAPPNSMYESLFNNTSNKKNESLFKNTFNTKNESLSRNPPGNPIAGIDLTGHITLPPCTSTPQPLPPGRTNPATFQNKTCSCKGKVKTIASNTNLNTFPDLESKEVELNPKSHTNTRPTDLKGSSVKRCSCNREKDSKSKRTQNGKSNNFSKDAFSNFSPVGSMESFQNLLGTKAPPNSMYESLFKNTSKINNESLFKNNFNTNNESLSRNLPGNPIAGIDLTGYITLPPRTSTPQPLPPGRTNPATLQNKTCTCKGKSQKDKDQSQLSKKSNCPHSSNLLSRSFSDTLIRPSPQATSEESETKNRQTTTTTTTCSISE